MAPHVGHTTTVNQRLSLPITFLFRSPDGRIYHSERLERSEGLDTVGIDHEGRMSDTIIPTGIPRRTAPAIFSTLVRNGSGDGPRVPVGLHQGSPCPTLAVTSSPFRRPERELLGERQTIAKPHHPCQLNQGDFKIGSVQSTSPSPSAR